MVHDRSIGFPPGTPYEELYAGHSLEIPDRFNIGVACADEPPQGNTALVVHDESGVHRLTFADLANRSARLAAGLRAAGIMKGDRIGVVLPQRWETAVAHLAVYRLGAIAVPLSPLFGPDALAFRLHDCEARLAIVDDSSHDAVRAAGGIETVHITGGANSVRGMIGYNQPAPAVNTHADDPALLIYTSGTTGPPKGVLHAHRVLLGHLPSVELYFDWFPQDGDICWTPADWAWIGGLMDVLMPSLYHGIPVVGSVGGKFDAARAVELMRREGVTCAFLPPTALRLMASADIDYEGLTLRSVFSGGEALGADTHSWARETLGVTINEGYGQTEMNLCVGNSATSWPVKPGSMGRPYPGYDVRILDDEGAEARAGETGHIAVHRGHPIEMLGYWNREHETQAKYQGDWLLTGDLGSRDDDGYLTFVSRTDDAISASGRRIGPVEIEQCLMEDPAVRLAAVVGIPDKTRGEIIKAFVVPTDRSLATPETAVRLAGRCRERLAPFLAPRRISFVTELPMTTSGKIKRSALRGP